jgi:heme oxygenase (mycobilin-producing)
MMPSPTRGVEEKSLLTCPFPMTIPPICSDRDMTVIKINAITVPEDAGDELARRFAARAGAVDDQEGFEGFELLRPTDDRRQWLVVTRWRDEESFQKWVASPAFAHGHAGADRPSPHGGPVSVGSELWSYEVAGGSKP